MHTGANHDSVFIGVGSNIDAEANIRRAFELLRERVPVIAVSPFYRSRAVGSAGQPDFLNGAFAVGPSLPPRELKFSVLREIEASLGRRRAADKNAARTIDLDILLYGPVRLAEPDIVIPDPGLRRYAFAALPLLALAPDIALPDTGEKLRELFPGRPEEYGLELLERFSADLAAGLRGRGRR